MKNKTTRRNELRRRIQDARQKSPKRYHYGPKLKREIVAYASECVAEGASINGVARDLELSATVLAGWLRLAKRRIESGKIPFERTTASETMSIPMPSAPDTELPEMVFVVRCSQVHISTVAQARLRELLDT